MHLLRILVVILSVLSFGRTKTMGPVGTITFSDFSLCYDEKSSTDDFVVNIELRSIDSEGTKAVFFNVSSKIDFDNTLTYKTDIRKWDSGWKPQLQREGKFCEDLQKFGPKLWSKMKDSMDTDFPDDCPVPAGTYTMSHYRAISSDLDIPSIFYGRMKAQVKLYDKDNNLLTCVTFEGDSQQPTPG